MHRFTILLRIIHIRTVWPYPILLLAQSVILIFVSEKSLIELIESSTLLLFIVTYIDMDIKTCNIFPHSHAVHRPIKTSIWQNYKFPVNNNITQSKHRMSERWRLWDYKTFFFCIVPPMLSSVLIVVDLL
jgi:hypothetical protein